MEILIQARQLILSLSILIVLHELGHFIPAKLFKTRVEKFYLFFNPWFSLFKKKVGETEYGIGLYKFIKFNELKGDLVLEFNLLEDNRFKDAGKIYEKIGKTCFLSVHQYEYISPTALA